MSDFAADVRGIFYLAMSEAIDATKTQPGEHLVHTIDVQELLNRAEKSVLKLGAPDA